MLRKAYLTLRVVLQTGRPACDRPRPTPLQRNPAALRSTDVCGWDAEATTHLAESLPPTRSAENGPVRVATPDALSALQGREAFRSCCSSVLSFPPRDVTIPRVQKGMRRVQNKNKPDYDVIVVGSGASGGWACKRLAEAGLKVALLEAGKPQSDANFTEHKPEFELKYRGHAEQLLRKTRPVQSIFACTE